MLLLVLIAAVGIAHGANQRIKTTGEWQGGFNGVFTIHADNALHGWKAHLVFDKPVSSLEVNICFNNMIRFMFEYIETFT